MKGFLKIVKRTHGGCSPCLVVDTTDGHDYTVPRNRVVRSTFRNATILIAERDDGTIYGMAKVTSFEEGSPNKPKTIRHLVGDRFTLEDLTKIEDCRGKMSLNMELLKMRREFQLLVNRCGCSRAGISITKEDAEMMKERGMGDIKEHVPHCTPKECFPTLYTFLYPRGGFYTVSHLVANYKEKEKKN